MRLSDCFMEIIAYTSYVVHQKGAEMLTYEQMRANMQRLINQADLTCEKGGVAREEYDNARFAVFAWVDETILSSQWQGRQQWQREQLQRQYYQTADAGELFFERLNGLGPHQRDVREIFYLCLALGFTGQYCNPGDEFLLEQLRTSNLKYLSGASVGLPALEKEELFPEAYSQGEGDPQSLAGPDNRWSLFTLVGAGAPVILLAILFLIYHFILGSVGDNLIGTL